MDEEDKKKGLHLSKEEILKRQKELFELGVLEQFTDYRISDSYFKEFLHKYSEVYGKPGSISKAILIPLFDIYKKNGSEMEEKELVKKAHDLYPIIRTMLKIEGVFKIIKNVVGKRKIKKNQNSKRD